MAESSERRRSARRKKDIGDGVDIQFDVKGGETKAVSAKLVDLTEFGCGLDIRFAMPVGVDVVVRSRFFDESSIKTHERKAQVIYCRLFDTGVYRIGLAFDEPEQKPKQAAGKRQSKAKIPDVDNSFADYYEALQISANADPETIQRVYRLLAQRYHPDNPTTGEEATFRMVLQAYRTLNDPEKRAAYDVKYEMFRKARWQIFQRPEGEDDFEEERRQRFGILAIAYRKRREVPDKPVVALRELEELLGCPREHLTFTIWYLRGKALVKQSENGAVEITPEGVEFTEEAASKRGDFKQLKRLEATNQGPEAVKTGS